MREHSKINVHLLSNNVFVIRYSAIQTYDIGYYWITWRNKLYNSIYITCNNTPRDIKKAKIKLIRAFLKEVMKTNKDSIKRLTIITNKYKDLVNKNK